MRIISAPARAECELDHRFMPSAKYSQCVNEAGGPEEQAVARGFDEAAALLFDVRIRRERAQSARSRPSVPSSSAPIRREYSATSAARIAGKPAFDGSWPCGLHGGASLHRQARIKQKGAPGGALFVSWTAAQVSRLEKRTVVARAR